MRPYRGPSHERGFGGRVPDITGLCLWVEDELRVLEDRRRHLEKIRAQLIADQGDTRDEAAVAVAYAALSRRARRRLRRKAPRLAGDRTEGPDS